jgi:hypothetical protein
MFAGVIPAKAGILKTNKIPFPYTTQTFGASDQTYGSETAAVFSDPYRVIQQQVTKKNANKTPTLKSIFGDYND